MEPNAVAPVRMGIRGVKLNLYRTTGGYLHVIEEDAHKDPQDESDCIRGPAGPGASGEDLSRASAQNVSENMCKVRA